MTTITIYQDHSNHVKAFRCLGHAGFADAGEDIVCAGISVLVINTMNSIAQFTDEKFTSSMDEKSGEIYFEFENIPEHDSQLLMDSMILGLQGIQNNYGNEYIMLEFKEV